MELWFPRWCSLMLPSAAPQSGARPSGALHALAPPRKLRHLSLQTEFQSSDLPHRKLSIGIFIYSYILWSADKRLLNAINLCVHWCLVIHKSCRKLYQDFFFPQLCLSATFPHRSPSFFSSLNFLLLSLAANRSMQCNPSENHSQYCQQTDSR